MYDAASSTAALATVYSTVGSVLVPSIAAIIAAAAALLALGFAWRHVKSKVTGKKF